MSDLCWTAWYCDGVLVHLEATSHYVWPVLDSVVLWRGTGTSRGNKSLCQTCVGQRGTVTPSAYSLCSSVELYSWAGRTVVSSDSSSCPADTRILSGTCVQCINSHHCSCVVCSTFSLYSASSGITTTETLRYGTCFQRIAQFYLHTHTFIRNCNEPYLSLPSQL